MAEDKLSFLDEPSVAPEAAEPEVTTDERPRDDKGRFATAEQETGESVESPAEPPEEPPAAASPAAETQDKVQHNIPLNVLLEERKSWQERMDREREQYSRDMAQLRAEMAQIRQPQTPPEPVQIPDPVENPQEYALFMTQRQVAALDHQEAQFSEHLARREYGTEAVDAALSAAQQAGVVNHFRKGIDRWSRLVEWHKQQLTAAEIGNDPAAYRKKLQAEIEAEVRAKIEAEMRQAAPARPRPVPPPPSIADAPSATARQPVGKGSGFDQAFPV